MPVTAGAGVGEDVGAATGAAEPPPEDPPHAASATAKMAIAPPLIVILIRGRTTPNPRP